MQSHAGEIHSAAAVERKAAVAGDPARRPKILFALAHFGFYRNFERTITDLASRGAEVVVVASKKHKSIRPQDYESFGRAGISFRLVKQRATFAAGTVAKLRVYRDALFYVLPEFRSAAGLTDRFASHQKGLISDAMFKVLLNAFRGAPGFARSAADRLLAAADESVPPHPMAGELIETLRPDVVVVSPLVHFHSKEVDLVKAARRRGVPTVLAVASWDNLTNKGVMKTRPDKVTVWNESMADEAVRLHRVDRRTIATTGATVFDWWFDRAARLDRGAFLDCVGIPEADRHRRVIVYLCSSVSIANGSEVGLMETWLAAIRRAEDPAVSGAIVIVRPHPMSLAPWAEAIERQDKGVPGDYTIFPTALTHPTSAEQRSHFLNTLLHADAIVGLNTSAMIEAAILGRPVLTFRGHAAEKTQSANLHFHHLADSGCVRVAADTDQHIAQLSETLRDPSGFAARCEDFVRRFVRPLGLGVEASLRLSEIILESAALPATAAPPPPRDQHPRPSWSDRPGE